MLAVFAVGLALILVLIGVALYVGGVFNSTTTPSTAAISLSTPTAPAVTHSQSGTTPSYTAPNAPEQSTKTFTGQVFTIQYPSGWNIKSNEQQHSWGTDTTIVSPSDANTYLRVDVTPNTSASSPRESAQAVITQLEKDPGYQQIDLSTETLAGVEALHWEFNVEESGVMLRKEDVFLQRNRTSVAVLTQAPSAKYETLRSQFTALRNSFSMNSA